MKDYRSRLTPKQREALFNSFVRDHLASTKRLETDSAASLATVNKRTAHLFYRYLRDIIYAHQKQLVNLGGEVEIDHATFNARRKKRYKKVDDKWVPLPTHSVLVFGLLERSAQKQHRVFVQIVKHADKKTTQPIVKHVVNPGTMLYSDMWRSFNDLGPEYPHKRVNHAKKQYARTEQDLSVHTGTIDQFWQFCDKRLGRFNGLTDRTIHLHIQECAYRYNHRHDLRRALRALITAHEQLPTSGGTRTPAPRSPRRRLPQS